MLIFLQHFVSDEISVEAGFKVQIHVQDEPPFIHELGFGIAPGFQTLVATQEQRASLLTSGIFIHSIFKCSFFGSGAWLLTYLLLSHAKICAKKCYEITLKIKEFNWRQKNICDVYRATTCLIGKILLQFGTVLGRVSRYRNREMGQKDA